MAGRNDVPRKDVALRGCQVGSDSQIGELGREESASFRARPALLQGRRIRLRIHGAESPKPGAGKGDDGSRGSRRPSGYEGHD